MVVCTDEPLRDRMPELTGCVVVYQPEAPFNCVKAWNAAAACTTGKVIIAISDDFSPPEHWDTLLANLTPRWMEKDRAVWVSDGYSPDICTLVIITRIRYAKFGYMLYPGYESMFSDTEHTAVSLRDGALMDARHLLFEHLHPDAGKRTRDDHDLLHASKDRWWRGETLFNLRKSMDFPNDTGLGQVCTPPPVNEFVAYYQVVRDDFCLMESCRRLYQEGVRRFFMARPDCYWPGEPVSDVDRASVDLAVRALMQACPEAQVSDRVFKLADYSFVGDARTKAECRLRNDSLAWVRQEGGTKILVLDADELWPPGMVADVQQATQHGATALACPMIPVIGLPGYPVAGAKDTATVYMGEDRIFFDCRSPVGRVSYLGKPLYHFTATRRTAEEIAIKHRQSGHYDDKRYRMDEWIEKVLPNIRPGPAPTLTGGQPGWHMYSEYQIWPELRHWQAAELAGMPESLRQYLGAAT